MCALSLSESTPAPVATPQYTEIGDALTLSDTDSAVDVGISTLGLLTRVCHEFPFELAGKLEQLGFCRILSGLHFCFCQCRLFFVVLLESGDEQKTRCEESNNRYNDDEFDERETTLIERLRLCTSTSYGDEFTIQ